jgi:hypothetical protein
MGVDYINNFSMGVDDILNLSKQKEESKGIESDTQKDVDTISNAANIEKEAFKTLANALERAAPKKKIRRSDKNLLNEISIVLQSQEDTIKQREQEIREQIDI